MLPDTPLLVTENGIATADDEDCIAFTAELGYAPTFELVSVDRQTSTRTPKPSLAWPGDVARRNAL